MVNARNNPFVMFTTEELHILFNPVNPKQKLEPQPLSEEEWTQSILVQAESVVDVPIESKKEK